LIKKHMTRYLITALISTFSLLAGGEELPRPVLQEYRLEIGGGTALSTYLSPLRYDGTVIGMSGQWSKASQWAPESLVMQFNAAGYMRDYKNPARTASMIGFDGMFAWGMQWRKRLPYSLQVTAGGSLDISGGCLYLTRNGNNPVTALASASLDINASLSWRFKIGKLPMVLSDEIRLPSLGCFFAPEYGETYYEIWLGNKKGLAHCGWWGNRFCIDNLLSLKLDFGRTAMEIGYRYDYNSSWANSLSTRLHTHTFVIGIIPHGLGIKRRAAINSPLY
jgi:hypothetical protein